LNQKTIKYSAVVMLLLFPATLSAVPRMAVLKKGQKAPFEGFLYDFDADAEMAAQRELAEEGCQLNIRMQLRRERNRHELLIKSAKISLTATEEKYKVILSEKNKEISRYEKKVEASGNGVVWGAVGYFAGVVSALATFYISTKIVR